MGSTSINTDHRNDRLMSLFSYTLVSIIMFCGVYLLWDTLDWKKNASDGNYFEKISLDLSQVGEVVLSSEVEGSLSRNLNCRFWNCLNLYRCGQGEHDRLTVYVYPLQDYTDKNNGKLVAGITREYYQILETVVRSTYYTSNPNEACLFLPSIDLLNHNMVESSSIANAFAAMSFWDSGENHLIFNMMSNISLSLDPGVDVISERAIIVGGGFDTWTYRDGFDVSLPVWSPVLQTFQPFSTESNFVREHKLIVAQLNVLPEHMRILESFAQDHPGEILLLKNCRYSKIIESSTRCSFLSQTRYEYPRILSKGAFCLLSRSLRLGQPDLLEMLANNCIPVIAVDNYVLPFDDVLDWSLFSIRIREAEIHSVIKRLKSVSHSKEVELRRQGSWVYNRYFKDLQTITLTTLEILEGRIFPHRSRNLHQWNADDKNYVAINPLYLPIIAPKSQGFTAVILTYDRLESLFTLIKKVALVPSLQSILVIWNNQKKTPPHLSTFPTISKPLKVIQTRANKLSNRFYPYTEIDTEAILTIDDDINMLTTDELDFGFEVWREFPDRIVGFPSRIHVWDNLTMSWRYESEWTNKISMVLTGAAFHHKFWSHMYTYSMPGYIKEWVDKHMNCEDIAMNFLVANVTNKPPIKVTPRKKFKCPECTNTEMLSADLNHMRERSACIDKFSRIYGRIPLRSVEFRADPVLFKDNFPEKLKRFNNIGSL